MFGLGSRNPQVRMMRIAMVVILLVAGLVFHHSGPTYTAIRVVYYVVIVGGLAYVVIGRRLRRRQGAGAAPGPAATAGSIDHLAPGVPATAPHQAGWYPDQHNMAVQRYWDGAVWTSTRRWDGTAWHDDEAGPGPAPVPETPPAPPAPPARPG